MATLRNKIQGVYNFTYVERQNTVDLTTIPVNTDNKCYVIDQRLLDTLLKRVTKGTLTEIKDELIASIKYAETKKDMFNELDNYIYLDKIVQMCTTIEHEPALEPALEPVTVANQY